ncbi:MAG: hypothetical protein FJZ66_07070 [Bacteroidetes bacterium]|nr:hypothetical protein [Bacteroidota bacterium]
MGNNYYFIPILSCILFFLSLIPFGVYTENILVAKIGGFLTLILTLIALRYWFYVLRKKSNRGSVVKLTTNDIYLLNKLYPFIRSWGSESLAITHGRIGIVLSEVRFLKNQADVSREEAIQFSFLVALKYCKQDLLPIAKSCISSETLEKVSSSLEFNHSMSFNDCVLICEQIELAKYMLKN